MMAYGICLCLISWLVEGFARKKWMDARGTAEKVWLFIHDAARYIIMVGLFLVGASAVIFIWRVMP